MLLHGRYSRMGRMTLERTVTNYIHDHGSPSERTRSRTSKRNIPPAPNSNTNAHLTTPSAGAFTRTQQITRPTQARAERLLRRSRLKLRKYLTSDRCNAELEHLHLRPPTRPCIEQFGPPNGDITSLPRATPGTWDSSLRMHLKKARRRAGRSGLCEVMINYAERDLDQEFGVLPGEVWGGEVDEDLVAEEIVVQGLTEDGRLWEEILDGERTGGVWPRLVCGGMGSEGVDAVVDRLVESGRSLDWRVMDPRCVELVRKLWDAAENV